MKKTMWSLTTLFFLFLAPSCTDFCSSNRDCDANEFCTPQGVCGFECLVKEDCDSGKTCGSRGKCVAKTGSVEGNSEKDSSDDASSAKEGPTSQQKESIADEVNEPNEEVNAPEGDKETRKCQEGTTMTCQSKSSPARVLGECRTGKKVCKEGRWSLCVGEVLPSKEVCDGKDNDCDGQTDEGCDCTSGYVRACGTATGTCKQGKQTCQQGKWSPTCVGEVLPSKEVCDGKDNNCDGMIDESLTRTCGLSKGICKQGKQTCQRGHWSTCQGSTAPSKEVCNKKDDDCNGVVDDVQGGCDASRKQQWKLHGMIEHPLYNSVATDFDLDTNTLVVAKPVQDPLTYAVHYNIQVWDTQKNHKRLQFFANRVGITDLILSPDKKAIASLDPARVLRVWNTATGKLIHTYRFPVTNITSGLAFSPDGTKVFALNQIRDIKKNTVVSLHYSRYMIEKAVFHPKNKTLAALTRLDGKNQVTLWDVQSGKLIKSTQGQRYYAMLDIAFRPDGLQIAVGKAGYGTISGGIELWDEHLSSSTFVSNGKRHFGGSRILFYPDNQRMLVDSGGEFYEIHLASEKITNKGSHSNQRVPLKYVWDKHGKFFASVPAPEIERTTQINIWDAKNQQVHKTFGNFEPNSGTIFFNAKGNHLVSKDTVDGNIHIWNAQTRNYLRRIKSNVFVAFDIHPKEDMIATSDDKGYIKLWDITTGKLMKTLPSQHSGYIASLAFSYDGQFLVSRSNHDILIVWNVKTGSMEWSMSTKPSVSYTGISSDSIVAFHPSNHSFTTLSQNKKAIEVWDAKTKKKLFSWNHGFTDLEKVTFDPSGTKIVIANRKKIQIRSIYSGSLHAEHSIDQYHRDGVPNIAFSSQRQELITYSKNKVVIWSLSSGKKVQEISIPTMFIEFLSLSSDEKQMVLSCGDGTIRILQAQ